MTGRCAPQATASEEATCAGRGTASIISYRVSAVLSGLFQYSFLALKSVILGQRPVLSRRLINIVYSDNGAGLSRDAVVIREALRSAGHRVSMTPRAPRKFPIALNFAPELALQTVRGTRQVVIRGWSRRFRRWDINIFLERLVPEYMDCARVNCLFTHQEWLTPEDRALLGSIDAVLFKTQHALELLRAETKAALFVGFTSPDRKDDTVSRRWDALHVAGWNPHKGTNATLQSWLRRPNWPLLTVVSQVDLSGVTGPNVEQISTRVSDIQLRHLQNERIVHVCPSEVEGFGHTLMEALSCGAIVVTTAAPPMDELVTPDEGFLVPYADTAAMGAGTRYLVNADGLSSVLDLVWSTPDRKRVEMQKAARARYEALRADFHKRFAQLIQDI